MKRKILLIVIISIASLVAQTKNKESIKNSTEYYWGESVSENEKEAEDAALQRLTKQIAVTVYSSFERNLKETSSDLQETVQDILKTFSTATLKNVKSIRNLSNGNIEVFLYITKSEVQKIFNERKKLIDNIYTNALEYEKEQNYAAALKSYYFAVLLINSIPEQNITVNNVNLTTEIPNRINAIISNTKFYLLKDTKMSDKERELQFAVEVFGKRAIHLDFSFWDGLNQVNVQTNDGNAIFELIGGSTNFNKLDLSIKYSYFECRNEISTVGELWNIVNRASFKNSKQVNLQIVENYTPESKISNIELDKKIDSNNEIKLKQNDIKPNIFNGTRKLLLINKDSCQVIEQIGRESEKLISILEKGSEKNAKNMYKDDSFLSKKIENVLKYNKIKIASGSVTANVNKTYNGWEVRKITVLNKYPTLNKQASEYMVLDFDSTGKLYDINFGIMDNLYEQFVEQGNYSDDWENRQVIFKFVEKYRTAFLSRNIEMLDSLFADEAVIIVGRVLKKTQMKDVYKYNKLNEEQPDVQYFEYTKGEYLKNQAKVFANQKDIYVGYNSFKISRKNKNDNVYGLSMRQNYQATTYSDEGYLFLLVDFNQKQPQIYVRSWQPQEWSESALIKLSNFNLNK